VTVAGNVILYAEPSLSIETPTAAETWRALSHVALVAGATTTFGSYAGGLIALGFIRQTTGGSYASETSAAASPTNATPVPVGSSSLVKPLNTTRHRPFFGLALQTGAVDATIRFYSPDVRRAA
jgi:hypothetical protein